MGPANVVQLEASQQINNINASRWHVVALFCLCTCYVTIFMRNARYSLLPGCCPESHVEIDCPRASWGRKLGVRGAAKVDADLQSCFKFIAASWPTSGPAPLSQEQRRNSSIILPLVICSPTSLAHRRSLARFCPADLPSPMVNKLVPLFPSCYM